MDGVDRHLAWLRVAAVARRTVALPCGGFAVARALEGAYLPRDDARCGVLHHHFQYGGSVPEGWAESRTLVLPDAIVVIEDYDIETDTCVRIQALTEARADELERAALAARSAE